MRWILFVLSLLAFLFGAAVFRYAVTYQSALHEIEALVTWVAAAVLFCVVDAIVRKNGAR